MQPSPHLASGGRKPFASSLGKMVVILLGYYLLELTIIGPQTDLYIIMGVLVTTTGMAGVLCTPFLIICGLPFGLILMYFGKGKQETVALDQYK